MRVFLTGGTGFFGSHVAAELLRRGHAVTCLVRPESDTWRLADIGSGLIRESADLRDKNLLETVLRQAMPDAICHLAWHGVLNTDRNDPRQEENVDATANLAAGAIKVGARAFVATGSQAEYGPLNRVVRESDPLNPTTTYGRAKCAARIAAQQICEKPQVRFAWLRVFSLYGPNDNETWLIPSLIDALSKGTSPKLTAGEQLWDFLYVADAAAAIVSVLETQTASGDFNLGSGIALPLRQAVETVRDIVSPRTALTFGEVPYRPDQVMHLQADISRLRAAVGWSPTTDFREGLKETVRRRRAGGVGWA